MNEIQEALLSFLPLNKKQTTSGWLTFNSACCHHRGESADTRSRGGVLVTPQGGFQYHCFNCQFKAGWTPGHFLSNNTKSLFSWLGLSSDDISKLGLFALKLKDDQPRNLQSISGILEERSLPDDCYSIDHWISQGCQDQELLDVIRYIVDERCMAWDWYDWHWSAAKGYRDRVILPFYQNRKIVGWTGRKITSGKPKYLHESQPGYVFNIDRQVQSRKYVIVVEGQFDAIAVDGVAVMRNNANLAQSARIAALKKEVILVPDRDRPGTELIGSALEYGWSVSAPPWESDIKDVADAVKRYGRLYTLFTILHYRETNELKIQLLKKKLEQQYE